VKIAASVVSLEQQLCYKVHQGHKGEILIELFFVPFVPLWLMLSWARPNRKSPKNSAKTGEKSPELFSRDWREGCTRQGRRLSVRSTPGQRRHAKSLPSRNLRRNLHMSNSPPANPPPARRHSSLPILLGIAATGVAQPVTRQQWSAEPDCGMWNGEQAEERRGGAVNLQICNLYGRK
jgi:hypothetical protein